MAFRLDNVVPWGRTFEEYDMMFQISKLDKSVKIAGFGDGPASFNWEANNAGYSVTSFDPIYQFSKDQISLRIDEVRKIVMKQMKDNQENFVWTKIRDLEQLEKIRMGAMNIFLEDFERGKSEGRYVYHELPERLSVPDNYFDVGISSHFLLLYAELGVEFHINAISEMLRICKEIRIFPILNLDSKGTELVNEIRDYFEKYCKTNIVETAYEFQKGGNKLLVMRKNIANEFEGRGIHT
ncbi:class I SAM-dependent methyltransferase [Anaeromicropila populeti]|uniref:SAM-dependent methyltransferase n=1 Tax=Anaeromicropila populeti TaxID=37658 RepID=A0A1I6ICW2_9FIRM|nr:SAM-dependent methyltransferase [Anaeromicropila populeti]SFR64533.1 hypothetical protein SAMN05661086_00703 [Anaeromicropila populeti]